MKRLHILGLAFLLLAAQSLTFAQATEQNRSEAVEQLIEKIIPIFPIDKFNHDIDQTIQNELGELIASLKRNVTEKLEADKDLEKSRKEAIMMDFEEFSIALHGHSESVFRKGLDLDAWVRNSLRKKILADLSPQERNELTNILSGEMGFALAMVFKEVQMADAEGREADVEALPITEELMEEVAEFFDSPLGLKYLSILDDDFQKLLSEEVSSWRDSLDSNIEKEIEGGELSQMIKKFLKDNGLLADTDQ